LSSFQPSFRTNTIDPSIIVNSYESGSSSHLVKVENSHQDDSFAEQLKTRPSIHLTLDIFEPINRSGGPALLRPVHCSIRR
ncbi:hypothetical protein, partial [Runella sp.]|uniref:hypothetical protein n=1 Tax=Runella sp. TaxID=1960881 RepID=UPI003015E0EC